MFLLICSLICSVRSCFQSRLALEAEIIALRHQLVVVQRKNAGHRIQVSRWDRIFWVWLSRIWSDWSSALLIVKPETVIAWHRKGFRLFWTWKSRHPTGRPDVSSEIRNLIGKMSLANPLWSAPKIHGELLKLGIEISETTVAKYMARHRKPPLSLAKTLAGRRISNLLHRPTMILV